MDYKSLQKKIKNYAKKYRVKVIGKSFFKRNIFAVEKIVNSSFPTAIFLCSIHARENIATDLVCKMIDDGLFENIKDFNLSFILMANPDGVELSKNGINSAPKKYKKALEDINHKSMDFSLWKANGRGVDLNNNFNANFGTNVGSYFPSSSGYVGTKPESEPETKAIVRYTKSLKTFLTISYHTKGEEIYFNFFQKGWRLKRDKMITEKFAESTGYVIKNPEMSSSGGYKDYCVQKLKIPALTIELGDDNLTHPLGENSLPEIFEKNKNVAKDLIFSYNVFKEFEEKYGIWWKIYEKGNCACKKSRASWWSSGWSGYC